MVTSSAASRLLARLVPILSLSTAGCTLLGACGGETVDGVGETGGSTAGAGGSTAGAGGSVAGAGGSTAGAGGSTAGAGGSMAGAGGSTAGAGGSMAGTGGSTAGAGGSMAGAGGSAAGAGGSSECVPSGGCEDVCYDRAVDEVCLESFGNTDALTARLGCTGQVWGASQPSDAACCYLVGQCGVGRPITLGGLALTAVLVPTADWR
jgi:hypothetical protein